MLIKYNNDSGVENRLLILLECLWDKSKMIHLSKILFHILSCKWSPIPPSAKPLRGHENLCEVRVKFSKVLYRIHYFVDIEGDYMVILNWYTKPDWRSGSDSYNKSKKKKIDKVIKASIEEAILLKENYCLNIWNYELYTK